MSAAATAKQLLLDTMLALMNLIPCDVIFGIRIIIINYHFSYKTFSFFPYKSSTVVASPLSLASSTHTCSSSAAEAHNRRAGLTKKVVLSNEFSQLQILFTK